MFTFIGKYKAQRSGYISIDAFFSMIAFLFLFLLAIGFFTYLQPYTNIYQQDFHQLTTLTERQGGLTEDDVEAFKERLTQHHYLQSKQTIKIQAETLSSGVDVTDVTPMGEEGSNYVHYDSFKSIEVTMVVPSNNQFFTAIGKVFGVQELSQTYKFREVVLSERY